jgi:hypothetical protein
MVETNALLKIRKWCFYAGMGSLLLAVLGVLFVAIAPPLLFAFGGSSSASADFCDSSLCQAIQTLVPVACMLLVVLGAILMALYPLTVLVTVGVSKNSSDYKAIWIVMCFFLGIIGAALWELIGKKELKP